MTRSKAQRKGGAVHDRPPRHHHLHRLNRSTWALAALLLLSLVLRLWGIHDRLPDPALGINLVSDTSVEENDRTTMTYAWTMWRGGTRPLDLNPHTGGWPALSFYVALLLQVLYYCYHSLLTGGASAYDFARHVQSSPDQLFLFARVVSSFLGVLTVFLSYRAAVPFVGQWGGLATGLLLATNPLHIATSQHIGDPNVLALLFVLLAIPPILGISKGDRLRNSVEAGAMIGLAGACKYVPLVLLLPYFLAHSASARGLRGPARWRPIVAGLAATAVAFFLASPFLLLDWGTTLHDLDAQRNSVLSAWVGQSSAMIALPRYLAVTLPSIMGWPAYALALLGCILLFRRGTQERLLLSVAAVLVAAVGVLMIAQARYVLPAIPVLFVATAIGVQAVPAWVVRSESAGTPRALVTALLIVGSAIWGMPSLIAARHAAGLPDSRHLARSWINQFIPARAPMALDQYGPAFNTKGHERSTVVWPFYATRASLVEAAYHLEWLDGIDFYVHSGEISRRYAADAARYPIEAEFYRRLQRQSEVAWKSDARTTSGPAIEVLKLPRSVSTRAARDSLWSTIAPKLTIRDQISRWCLVMSEDFYLSGDLERAEEWGERGLTIPVPSTARQLYSTLGLAEIGLGKVDAFERTARGGVAAYPEDSQLHLFLGMAMQQRGDARGAIAHYRESLRLNPDQERADGIRRQIETLEGRP